MIKKNKGLASLIFISLILLSASSTMAQGWTMKLSVQHRAQQENWSCGPNTIAMWAGYINQASYDTNQIASKYTGTDGTTIPEFDNAMYRLTPYGYVFSEWAYSNQYA